MTELSCTYARDQPDMKDLGFACSGWQLSHTTCTTAHGQFKDARVLCSLMQGHKWQVDLMHIMAVLIHSFGEVLHSVEQGAQGLLAGQGLPEGSQKGSPLSSNIRCLIL